MTKLKKSTSILLSALMLIGIFAIAPIAASAYDVQKPQNFRVKDIDLEEGDKWSVTLAWSPAAGSKRYSYQLVWNTSPETDWNSDRGASPSDWWCNDNNTGDYTYKINSLTYGTTYYFFVRWVANEYPKTSQRVDFGHAGDGLPTTVAKSDYAMIKFDWKTQDDSNASNTNKSPSIKVKSKTIKASALKKSNQTIKPLTIKNAKSVKVVKVKKGTTAKIYKKIKVAKKTGAIKFKKGKYKKGTYKIKLKIKLDSKTFNKTVKVKIK
ncbi:MAG: fibronectin type III domain-containing protein [Ruminococcus sp.]|nr:fibronectin type III domain-containing protein [Ruminococcus sp.]